MPVLRRDPLTGTWVILSPERSGRPQYLSGAAEPLTKENCPFCPRNESMTPPELFALRGSDSRPDQEGWRVRVVPNKYPALRPDSAPGRQVDSLYCQVSGIGAHEVVIETPDHEKGMDQLSQEHVADIFRVYRQRINMLKRDHRIQAVQIFKNHAGLAGATIPHPHSQILALPIIPRQTEQMVIQGDNYYESRERCFFCDILKREQKYRERVLLENEHFTVFAPFAARLPFALNIYPKAHRASFEDSDAELLSALAHAFRETMILINKTLNSPAYNLVLHNAPFKRRCKNYFHWHLELVPILAGTGGFELGTFSYINPTPPEEAIAILKGKPTQF